MSEAKHTPGPWIFRSGGDLEVKTKRGVEMLQTPAHVVKVDQDGEGRKRTMFICDCAGVGLPNEANARLIAAAPETAAELERLRQERAQMGLRIFVAEKELKKIALNHAEPARSGVVAAIGALNGDFPNGAKGTELEIDRLRETSRMLLDACKAARLHLQPDLEEPGRTVFWKLVDVINRAEGKA